MPATSDPLGLTAQQRTESNMFAAFRRREVWWPPEVDDRVIDGEGPCAGCDVPGMHAPDCTALVARVLHEQGLELDMQLVPRGSTP